MSRKLNLQDFLPYLLNRAGLRIGVMFSRDIEDYDVTLPMWRVLLELWHHGDHRLGELSERTSIDLSTLSRLLVVMQRRKLIVRRRSGLDGRALSVTLTQRGLELAESIEPYATRYEDIAIKGMSDSDIRTFKDLLKIAYRNLETADREVLRQQNSERPRAKKRVAKSPVVKPPAAKTPAKRRVKASA
jgi:DNA-binding MarR family transcriptional regulator